jgi:hypothetical protein
MRTESRSPHSYSLRQSFRTRISIINAPVSHTENNSPTLLLHGSTFTRIVPRRFGMKYTKATQARESVLAAMVTPVQMVTISTTPSTHPRSVV